MNEERNTQGIHWHAMSYLSKLKATRNCDAFPIAGFHWLPSSAEPEVYQRNICASKSVLEFWPDLKKALQKPRKYTIIEKIPNSSIDGEYSGRALSELCSKLDGRANLPMSWT